MFRKKLLQVVQFSTIGVAGYYVGQLRAKPSSNEGEEALIINGRTVTSMPGLPIFGTVSAAAPFSDSGTTKTDRV